MNKISVVISAYNEEENIKDCLESVRQLADEIILVDNTSSDKTLEIAKKYTSKTFVRPNNLMLNINKNFGFGKATGDWILSLDADERVEPELVASIKNQVLSIKDNPFSGYKIPRKNIIFGKWIQYTGWYPDYQLRLFRKGMGRFAEEHVHEQLTLSGEVGTLKENLLHHNYTTVSQFLYKMNQIYVPNEAQNILEGGKKVVWQDAIGFPVQEFFRRFFADQGWKDGLHGLVLSILMAFYHFLVFVQIWEKQGFWEVEEKEVYQGVKDEFKQKGKDFSYWLTKMRMDAEKSFTGKFFLKLKQKLS